jgi:putative colanic acid biosynthesis acetyltransferase WcaF
MLIESQQKPQQTPFESPWSWKLRLIKQLWDWSWSLFCGWTPKPLNGWRLQWLKWFGASLEGRPFVHGRARIEMPWNLVMEDRACLGDRSHVYNLAKITIQRGATVAQEAYLCAGTHDFSSPALPLVAREIIIGEEAFLGLRVIVLPGIKIGARAVVGAGSVVTNDVLDGRTVAGNPAREIGQGKKVANE